MVLGSYLIEDVRILKCFNTYSSWYFINTMLERHLLAAYWDHFNSQVLLYFENPLLSVICSYGMRNKCIIRVFPQWPCDTVRGAACMCQSRTTQWKHTTSHFWYTLFFLSNSILKNAKIWKNTPNLQLLHINHNAPLQNTHKKTH